MTFLFDRTVAAVLDELALSLPAAVVEADLRSAGLPLDDPRQLRSFLVSERRKAIARALRCEKTVRPVGRAPIPLVWRAVQTAAFEEGIARGLGKREAQGAAAQALGSSIAKVEKATRSVYRSVRDGDALASAVLDTARRILPRVKAELSASSADAVAERWQRRHAAPIAFSQPISAHSARR